MALVLSGVKKMAAIRRRKIKNIKVHSISKLELIKRLEAMHKFKDALKILKSDELLYEKWSAASEIKIDDKNARNLLEVLGLEPDAILSN